jgi:glycosyltransferase involved in cell wall biosynthesis
MATQHDGELIIVMPIYNEEANLRYVLQSWFDELDRLEIKAIVYAINDGSRDGTRDVLKDLQAKQSARLVVFDKPNSGHGRSCRFGYDRACETEAEWILQIDSDGQCDPAYFNSFWRQREDADCIIGFRTTRGDGITRFLAGRACTALTYLWTGQYLMDANVPYRLIRRSVLRRALALVPPDFDVHNVALMLALKRDKRNRFRRIPIHFPARRAGANSIGLSKILRMGSRMLLDLKRVDKPRDRQETR